MATAPTPGLHRRRDQRRGRRVTIRDQHWDLDYRDIGPQDDHIVRAATGGIPLSTYIDGVGDWGLDSIGIIIWTARRKAGEPRLRLAQVYDELPSKAEFDELAESGEFTMQRLEDLDDEPEIDGAPEGATPDPLPDAEA